MALLAPAASLEAQVAAPPEANVTQHAQSAGATADELRQQLFWLEAQEHELAARMLDGHPKLAAVREQIRELKKALPRQPATNIAPAEMQWPPLPRPQEALSAEKEQGESLKAHEQALAEAQDVLRGKMTELNAQTAKIDELTRRLALAEQSRQNDTNQLEQARTGPTPSGVSTYNARAAFIAPQTAMIAALGLFIAVVTGITAIRLAARRKRLIVTAQQLAAAIDVPLAAVIPRGTLTAA